MLSDHLLRIKEPLRVAIPCVDAVTRQQIAAMLLHALEEFVGLLAKLFGGLDGLVSVHEEGITHLAAKCKRFDCCREKNLREGREEVMSESGESEVS